MTDWETFWRFMGQLVIVVMFVLAVYATIVELRKTDKKDQ